MISSRSNSTTLSGKRLFTLKATEYNMNRIKGYLSPGRFFIFVLFFPMVSGDRKLYCDISPDPVYGGNIVNCIALLESDLQNLPFENTTTLLISNSFLPILTNHSLSNFKLLRCLKCSKCSILGIQPDALRGLTNLESLKLDTNDLQFINGSIPKGVFKHVPHLKTLDIQNNVNLGTIVSYSDYIDIFDSLPELRHLFIDSFYNLRIGEEFVKLRNLQSLRIYCKYLKSISNFSLDGFQNSNVSQFHLIGDGVSIPRDQIGLDVFQFLPNISDLNVNNLRIGNQNMLRLMKPLSGRNMKRISLNGTFSSPYSPFQQKIMDGVVTVEGSKYLCEICVEEFYWYNSHVTTIERDAPLTPTWQQCLVTLFLETDIVVLDVDSSLVHEIFRMQKLQSVTRVVVGHKLVKQFWDDDTFRSSQMGISFKGTSQHDDDVKSSNPSNQRNIPHQAIKPRKTRRTITTGAETTSKDDRYCPCLTYSNSDIGKEKFKTDESYHNSYNLFAINYTLSQKSINESQNRNQDDDIDRRYMFKDSINLVLPPALKSFELDSKQFSSIPFELKVSPNNVSSMAITNCPYQNGLSQNIYGFDKLETIDFQGSVFFLDPDSFSSFLSLKKLILRRTQSIYIQLYKEIVEKVPSLEYLDIAENYIQDLEEGIFHSSQNLKYLCLASNRFSTFPFDLKFTPNLQILDLRGNSFVELSFDDRTALDDHTVLVKNLTILLDNNQWSCSCSHLPFMAWLQETKVQFDNQGNYSCISEDGTRSFTASYKDVMGFWRKCHGRYYFLLSLIIACALTAGYMGLFMGMKHKTQIISKVRQVVTPGFRLKTRQDFKYDVCIGYADEEGDYVRNVLLRYLEDAKHLKTFVHQRDLMQDPLLMSEAIRDSWRCLLIITDNFLYRYHMAHNVMKVASFFVTASNPRSLVVLVVEEVMHQIPDYILQVVDEDNMIVVPPLHGFLDYETKEFLKTRLL